MGSGTPRVRPVCGLACPGGRAERVGKGLFSWLAGLLLPLRHMPQPKPSECSSPAPSTSRQSTGSRVAMTGDKTRPWDAEATCSLGAEPR